MGDASVTKKPRARRGKRARKESVNSFGSSLDEVGWKPGERKLLAPGTVGPQLRARIRLEMATADIAAEQRFGGPSNQSTELEIMEEATRLVQEARYDAHQSDNHDVVEAAALYIDWCVANSRRKPIEDTLPSRLSDPVMRKALSQAVHDVVRNFGQGDRLTEHHSGNVYVSLRERFSELRNSETTK